MSFSGPSSAHDAVRKARACVPCHERKVRCNASLAGLPCSRCLESGRDDLCKLFTLPDRSAARRRKLQSISRSHVWNQQLQSPPVQRHPPWPRHGTDLEDRRIIQNMRQGTSTGPDTSVADLEAIDPDTAAVSEEESQLETCRNMAGWGNDPASPIRVSGRTKRREVLEYHDRINSTTILGELFGQSKPQRLVRITLSTTPYSEPGQTEPAEGVDLEFLRRRGAFNLPSQPIWYVAIRSIGVQD